MRPLLPVCALAALSVAAGCDADNFEQFQEVQKLRVLAIRATPPELGAGADVVLDALVPSPDGRPVRYAWELCAFDQGPDAYYACASDPETGEALGVPLGDTPSVTVPASLASLLGDIEALCDEIGSVDVPDFIELPDCTRGFPLRVRLTVSVGDGEGQDTEIAVSTLVLLREGAVPNNNPTIGDVSLDETVLVPGVPGTAALPGDDDEPLAADVALAESESESYTEGSGDAVETRRETLKLTWFTTHGAWDRTSSWYADGQIPIEELRENELDLTGGTRPAEAGDEVTLYFVARDGRGGVDFTTRTLTVAP